MAGPKYASGKWAISECDVCSFRYPLKELKKLIIKTKNTNIKACPACWTKDHPQLQLGMYPVYDPQALREPRPDVSYYQSGLNGLQTLDTVGLAEDQTGTPEGGSRVFQWGWNPVGGASGFDTVLTPNYLILQAQVGNVTVSTT